MMGGRSVEDEILDSVEVSEVGNGRFFGGVFFFKPSKKMGSSNFLLVLFF